jgi:mannose-6-phosphate isomerase-like protein (cupin superfamily)
MSAHLPTSDGPRIVRPDEGRTVTVMGAQVRYLLPADNPVPGRFSVFEYSVPAFYAAPPTLHHHLEDDWAALLLEGSVTFVFKTGPQLVDTGSLVWCPHGTPFAWRNESDQPARILFIHAPRGFEEFFSELAGSLAAAGATRVTPAVAAEVIEPLWAKYGLAVSED